MWLPVGSLPHSAKPTLLVWVQVILAGEESCQGAPAPQSHLFVSGVVPQNPGVGQPEQACPVQQPEEVVPEVVEIEETEEDREPDEMPWSEAQEAAAFPTPHWVLCHWLSPGTVSGFHNPILTIVLNDSGLRTGLFNTKLHLEILHQDYIAKQY